MPFVVHRTLQKILKLYDPKDISFIWTFFINTIFHYITIIPLLWVLSEAFTKIWRDKTKFWQIPASISIQLNSAEM